MKSYFYTPPVQIQAVDVLRPKSVIVYNLIVVLKQILEKESFIPRDSKKYNIPLQQKLIESRFWDGFNNNHENFFLSLRINLA